MDGFCTKEWRHQVQEKKATAAPADCLQGAEGQTAPGVTNQKLDAIIVTMMMMMKRRMMRMMMMRIRRMMVMR